MAHDQGGVLLAEAPNNRQRYFVRYLTAILIDLLVLNLFAEYTDGVDRRGGTDSVKAATPVVRSTSWALNRFC